MGEKSLSDEAGGTTTDMAVLVKGLPRPAAATVHIAGVHTNFAMPDLHSIGASAKPPAPSYLALRCVYCACMGAWWD